MLNTALYAIYRYPFCIFSRISLGRDIIISDFYHAFIKAVNEQNAFLATIPKPATFVSPQGVLL